MIRRVSSFVFRVSMPVLLVALGGTAETHKYTPKKEDLKYTFATAAPVLKLKPGDTLETWTERADGNTLQKPGDWFPPGRRPNPQTGPFYIEGAEPGDTLVIHLISVEPAADVAVGYAGPGFGALTATRYTPMLDKPFEPRVWFYRVDKQARTVEFAALDSDFKVKLPLKPFLGCLGVAPAADEARATIVPEFFGGNMDTPEVRAGTTVYLPVNAAGAVLYLGDGRAVQGEGEIAGTAADIYRPLEDAMRIASRELIQWLTEDYGLSAMDAYELLSVAMESNVSQIVDTNFTVLVKIKKDYLPPKKR